MIYLVTGMPRSYTSMLMKFIMDNGGNCPVIEDNPDTKESYPNYEDTLLNRYAINHMWKDQVEEHLKGFAETGRHKSVFLKAPLIALRFPQIANMNLGVPIRVIYVIRNITDCINSNLGKSGGKFSNYVTMNQKIYLSVIYSPFATYAVLSERIRAKDNTAARYLLDFCGLYPNQINYTGIREL